MSKFVSSLFHRSPGSLDSNVTSNSVQYTARELAAYTVACFTQSNEPSAPNDHAKTLKRTVDEISGRHEILFLSMFRQLADIVSREPAVTFGVEFQRIADELFKDGQINWGRIVTVYAFAGWLARYAATHSDMITCSNNEDNADDTVDGTNVELLCPAEQISKLCGDYVAVKLSDWILQQGGWDTFDKFFAKQETADTIIWNGLLYTFVGLAALATVTTALKN